MRSPSFSMRRLSRLGNMPRPHGFRDPICLIHHHRDHEEQVLVFGGGQWRVNSAAVRSRCRALAEQFSVPSHQGVRGDGVASMEDRLDLTSSRPQVAQRSAPRNSETSLAGSWRCGLHVSRCRLRGSRRFVVDVRFQVSVSSRFFDDRQTLILVRQSCATT